MRKYNEYVSTVLDSKTYLKLVEYADNKGLTVGKAIRNILSSELMR